MKKQFKYCDTISLNDKDFFNEVFDELYIPLVLFAKSYLSHNQELAEDIIQEVFTNILVKKTKFKNKISLKSYLYLSVKNSCLNHHRHINVRQLYIENEKIKDLNNNPPFLEKIILEEAKYQLVKALDKLPIRCKKVFELSLKGFKNNEIAKEMKISIETVKSHKKKGKRLLKSLLNPAFQSILFFF